MNKAEVVTLKRKPRRISVFVKSLVTGLFPEKFYTLNKTRIKSKGKVETPHKIATLSAERIWLLICGEIYSKVFFVYCLYIQAFSKIYAYLTYIHSRVIK